MDWDPETLTSTLSGFGDLPGLTKLTLDCARFPKRHLGQVGKCIERSMPRLTDLNLNLSVESFTVDPECRARGTVQMPLSLGELASLTSLRLEITGNCHAAFIHTTCLKTLVSTLPTTLSSLVLDGCSYIPCGMAHLHDLSRLTLLQLGNSSFPADFPFGSLRHLTVRGLSLRQLRHEHTAIGMMTQLRSLDIFHMEAVPPEIGNLTHLHTLSLSRVFGGDVKDFPDGFSRLQSLRVLRMTQCGLDVVPGVVTSLTGLRELSVTCCDFLTSIPPLGHLSSLRKLDFSRNVHLTDPRRSLDGVTSLTSLTHLDLHRCLSLPVPALHMPNLEFFDVTGCAPHTTS